MNLLESPTVISSNTIFQHNFGTGNAAYRVIPTILDSSVDVSRVEAGEPIVKGRVVFPVLLGGNFGWKQHLTEVTEEH